MRIDLTSDLEKLVEARLLSGRYDSPEEVLREALSLLDRRDQLAGARREEYKQQIEEGWLAARRGDLADGDRVFDRIDAEMAAMEPAAGERSVRG